VKFDDPFPKPNALLHHSDQGSQYASEQFQKLMADNGVDGIVTSAARLPFIGFSRNHRL
jgi:transposase InsO family protein